MSSVWCLTEPDEPSDGVRYGDWWVPEDCPAHLGGVS